VHLECKLHCTLALPGNHFERVHHVVIGRVVGVHIRDDALTADGKLDVLARQPLARLGYFDYTTVDSLFTMLPTGPHLKVREAGLEGRPVCATA
jgi:flavin reductase (DIM6/NTAB) family NADH-FMN oxidoreductase RutF